MFQRGGNFFEILQEANRLPLEGKLSSVSETDEVSFG